MDFKLWVYEQDGQAMVFHELTPALQQAFGDALKEHTVTLRAPLTAALTIEQDRLCWVTDPIRGYTKDPSLDQPAFVQAFVKEWTFSKHPTMEAFLALHPVIAQAVHARAYGMVYPSPFLSQPWIEYVSRQVRLSEEGSAQPA